jgi:transcriptional regulator with XRE-family HTH domain
VISSAAGSDTTPKAYFGVLLRQWRAARRMSQLTLALDADISIRHLSCVETGRAQPSLEMVLRLAKALEIPLRERAKLNLSFDAFNLFNRTNVDEVFSVYGAPYFIPDNPCRRTLAMAAFHRAAL